MSKARLRPSWILWLLIGFVTANLSCSNDPYPGAEQSRKIRYGSYGEAPKTLDPAVAYTTASTAITSNVYETLLEYHYLKRPYTLIPGLAEAVPQPEVMADGSVVYQFRLQEGLLFQDDPCFEHFGVGKTRSVLAEDFAFELQRIADPAVTSPVISTFAKIQGLQEFSGRLTELREADETFAKLPIQEQYEKAGGIAGVRVKGERDLEIALSGPYPQILYWFAMPFTAPVPWEAVEYYDGEEERDAFQDHPVGAGPYRLSIYEKRHRMVLDLNPNWYGTLYPERKAPGATYPSEGDPGDEERGFLRPAVVGSALPFVERIEYRLEKEDIPAFGKFLQGYYDASGVIRESFDKVIREDELSPEMHEFGMRLEKSVSPDIYYIGFNMDDDVVGRAAKERGKKLRQAMSLVVDIQEFTRVFANGRGVPAESLLPPGIFGYEESYRNPYRKVDLERAQQLLEEAGYPGGIDPATGKPLRLTFDSPDTSAQGKLRFTFFVNAWRKLGIDVEIKATNYNQFQEKVRKGAYQVFMWGWVADYPDPENFLFLLWTPMGRTASGGPNSANFSNPRYDELFLAMKSMDNTVQREEIIREMREILEEERPWIELFHRETYALYHSWLDNLKPAGLSLGTAKYIDIDPVERQALRREWNEPVLWPLGVLGVVSIAILVPGIMTFYRERQ